MLMPRLLSGPHPWEHTLNFHLSLVLWGRGWGADLRLLHTLLDVLLLGLGMMVVMIHGQWLVSCLTGGVVVACAVLLLLLLGVPIYVRVLVRVVMIAVIWMLELTDEVLLVSGCCSWAWTCACDVVAVYLVITVEGSYGSNSNSMLMAWMHNLTLLLLLVHLLSDFMTVQGLWSSRHVHYVLETLIKLNILIGSFARQLCIWWNHSTLAYLLIHRNPRVLLNFPNNICSSVLSAAQRNCPLFRMIGLSAARGLLAWRWSGNSVLNCCHCSIFISFNNSRLWFVNTAV
jgi:hypothetical protein